VDVEESSHVTFKVLSHDLQSPSGNIAIATVYRSTQNTYIFSLHLISLSGASVAYTSEIVMFIVLIL
jgi:hypothetical protein